MVSDGFKKRYSAVASTALLAGLATGALVTSLPNQGDITVDTPGHHAVLSPHQFGPHSQRTQP